MWLSRDPASPFYNSFGVTANERPVLARRVAAVFERAGFEVSTHYLSGLAYRYVASARARLLLPIYNLVDATVFGLPVMERLGHFVITAGATSFLSMTAGLDIVIRLQRRPQHR
jgi:hypothetical protein